MRKPAEEREALSALRRWMRADRGAALILGTIGEAAVNDGGGLYAVEAVSLDASPYQLVDFAGELLARAYRRLAAGAEAGEGPQIPALAAGEIAQALACLGKAELVAH